MDEMKEIVGGYEIQQKIAVGERLFVLAENKNAVQPFVTWQGIKTSKGYDYNWGRYFADKEKAQHDLHCRVYAERTGKSYHPSDKKRDDESR